MHDKFIFNKINGKLYSPKYKTNTEFKENSDYAPHIDVTSNVFLNNFCIILHSSASGVCVPTISRLYH